MTNVISRDLEPIGWVAATQMTWVSLARNPPGLVFVVPSYDSIPSPVGNAIPTLIEALAHHSPVPVAILAAWPSSGEVRECPLSPRILYFQHSRIPTLLEQHLPWRVRTKLWATGFAHRRYARAVGVACATLGAGVVVVEDMSVLCRLVRRYCTPKTRVILHQHGDSPKRYVGFRWRSIQQQVDSTIFVAETTKRGLEAQFGKMLCPSRVVYNGVSLDHYDPNRWVEAGRSLRRDHGISSSATILLFVGRIVAGKGCAEAAEGYNLATVDNSHFFIVGEADRSNHMNSRNAARLEMAVKCSSRRIQFVGAISQNELPAYYAAADVVIVPSTASEGLPKVVTEALAMAKPVLASNRGGIWELLAEEQNAWMIEDPSDPKGMARAIRRALKDCRGFRDCRWASLSASRARMSDTRMSEEFYKAVFPEFG